MYTTKLPFKGADSFSKTGYNAVGEKYVDPGKRVQDDRYKGKQISTAPATSTFGKFESLFVGEPYDKNPKKKENLAGFGFGSKDAANRDEFSDTLNVLRYREKLESEKKYRNRFLAEEAKKHGDGDSLDKAMKAAALAQQQNQESSLFDAVFNNNDDAVYDTLTRPKQHARPRNMGPYKTSAMVVGGNVNDANYNVKRFGKKNCTKEFMDHGGM